MNIAIGISFEGGEFFNGKATGSLELLSSDYYGVLEWRTNPHPIFAFYITESDEVTDGLQ